MRPKDPEKIARIQEAAVRVHGKYGFSGITIGRISQVSGLSTGAIYTYFKSKEDLLHYIFDAITQKRIQAFPVKVDESQSSEEIFNTIWQTILEFETGHYEQNSLAIDFFFSSYSTPEKKIAFLESNQDVLDAIKILIERAHVKPLHPVAVAKFMMYNIRQMIAQKSTGYLQDMMPSNEVCKEMIWDALRVQK